MNRVKSSESLKYQELELNEKNTQGEKEEMNLAPGRTDYISGNDLIQTRSCNSNNDNMDLTKICDENENVGEVISIPTESKKEIHGQPHSYENEAKVMQSEYHRLEVGAIGGNTGSDANTGKDEYISNTKHCEPCLFDEIEENAVAFCVICIEYLCKGCARDHRRSKVTRSHNVLHNHELPKDASIFKLLTAMVCCSDHPEMGVSYKCEEHAKFICTRCMVENHRKCSEVTEVSNEPVSPTKDYVEPTLLDEMKTLHDKTISVRMAKEENISSMFLEQATITKERTTYIECIQEHVLKLNEQGCAETEAIFTKELVELEKDVKECREIEKWETMHIELLNVAMHYDSAVVFNVISEEIKKNLLTHELKIQDIKETVHLKFEKITHFIDLISMGNVLVLRGEKKQEIQSDKPEQQGNVKYSSDAVEESILPDINNQVLRGEKTQEIQSDKPEQQGNVEYSSDAAEESILPDINNQVLKRENNFSNALGKQVDQQNCLPLMQCQLSRTRAMYDIHHDGDRYVCSISGIVVLSDGRLAMVDDNNDNIKFLNPDFSIAFVYELKCTPLELCQISDTILVIICFSTKRVNRYSICNDTIMEVGGFHTKLYPISIDKCNDNVVILFSDVPADEYCRSDNDIIEVQIRNINTGAIIQTITEFNSKSSREMILKNPSRIRVRSAELESYLISEDDKLNWFELDTNNDECFKETWFYKSYKDNHIRDIRDIAMDMEGNIYVCGQHSRNIHQISGENFMHNRVLLHVPGNPISVSVDDKRRHLIVGFDYDNCIHVIPFV